METAYEWGVRHKSCEPALEMRKNYKSQAEWWRACDRGDWLLWQLNKIELNQNTTEALTKAIEKIVTRAVTNHASHCGIKKVEKWAEGWLSGKDRSVAAAEAARAERAAAWAAWAAAWAAAEAAEAERAAAWAAWAARAAAWAAEAEELRLQSQDIHELIPVWPG